MARRKAVAVDISFAFWEYLWRHYRENRSVIRRGYRRETRKFLDFNNPENRGAFLREPQFEALEMYVFLKEGLDNRRLHEVFDDWYRKKGGFAGRSELGMRTLFGAFNEDVYREVFRRLKESPGDFPNFIFALTMGTGKTILMAACIFYEFILAERYPDDPRYCHNALVFAPDKTVLQSLREIKTFDKVKIVPPRWLNWLDTNLQFHFLDDTGATLSLIDRSRYNIVISNTQKIILKKRRKDPPPINSLFGATANFEPGSVYDKYRDLYDAEDEAGLIGNQRFTKLSRIGQLGVYVDEAHHAFGKPLSDDLTALRETILELNDKLARAGTRIVATYNFTGTPYVGSEVLPEVVYAYGLSEAIRNRYLKKVEIHSFAHTKELTFVREALTDFWQRHKGKRYEGKRAKIAFFASTIAELEKELQPRVEKVMEELGIPQTRLLINVGDETKTSSEDIKEFNRLDEEDSGKQVILLVNKGKEGWNCRSLFSVALFREPKSKIFVLQATMRCMRSIGPLQETATVYMTEDCKSILIKELDANFRMTLEELHGAGGEKKTYKVKPVPPPIRITVSREAAMYRLSDRSPALPVKFGFEGYDLSRYTSVHRVSRITDIRNVAREGVIEVQAENRRFSEMTLVAEIARYLNRPCLEIECILHGSDAGVEATLEHVNQHNELLYDVVIPEIFHSICNIEKFTSRNEEDLELIKEPPGGYYEIQANPMLVASADSAEYLCHKDRSFHVDHYCFDSGPEKIYFDKALRDTSVAKVWFTGMFKHGQSEFFIPYIDPETYTLRSYYPDFLVKKTDGNYQVVEVKGDNKIDNAVVVAKKEAAESLTRASQMTYVLLQSSNLLPVDKTIKSTKRDLPLFDNVADYSHRMFKDFLPVYSLEAACGKFGEGQEVECEGWTEVKGRRLDERMFIARAIGRSMEPTIHDGDFCIFRANPEGTRQGKIVLVQHRGVEDPETGGSYTIKKYSSEKMVSADEGWGHSRITLSPLNPNYQPIEITGTSEDIWDFRVIAELVAVLAQAE